MPKTQDRTLREIWTGHVTQSDGALLSDPSTPDLTAVSPDGVETFLRVGQLQSQLLSAGFSPAFRRIYHDALRDGVHYLLFSPEASPLPHYPTFNW